MKARVKENVRYGAAGKHGPGEIVVVIQAELDAFSDKLELVKENLTKLNATDAAIKLAEEENVDLGKVDGTGVDGRILVGDVMDYLGD